MNEAMKDRGWAWVCCFGAAMNLLFVVGGIRSVGLIFIELIEIYESSRLVTSMIVAFLAAGFAVTAPVANALAMKFTMRKVVFIGGAITGISCLLTAFAPNIHFVILVFGVWTGIGYGMMFGPSLVVVGMYFQKRRSLANGLAAAGGSLGQLLIPQLLHLLIQTYGFKGCMMIYSAVILHALPAAMLYRPLHSTSTQADSQQVPQKEQHVCKMEYFELKRDADVSKDTGCITKVTVKLDVESNKCATENTNQPKKDHTQRSVTCRLSKVCKIFEWQLFRNWLFVIYVLGLSCGHGGYINLCMFLPPYATELNINKSNVALLLSIIGISDLLGRILGGWFADLGIMKRSNIMAACLSFTGGCALLVPMFPRLEALMVFAVILGLIGGVYVSLMVVVIIDFMGINKLAPGFGLATMCMGLATIPIPVILGILKDVLGSFTPAVRICGTLMVLGGTFFSLEPIARRLQARKR